VKTPRRGHRLKSGRISYRTMVEGLIGTIGARTGILATAIARRRRETSKKAGPSVDGIMTPLVNVV
jgi:hypothetical protein